jgi:excisionase family DNA binding protein
MPKQNPRAILDTPEQVGREMSLLADPQGDECRDLPRYLRVADACRYAQIGKTKLYELLDNGEIVSKKVGRTRIVDASSIDYFMASLPVARAHENAVRRRWREGRHPRLGIGRK